MSPEFRSKLRQRLKEDEENENHDYPILIHLTKEQKEFLNKHRINKTHGRHGLGFLVRRMIIKFQVSEEMKCLLK